MQKETSTPINLQVGDIGWFYHVGKKEIFTGRIHIIDDKGMIDGPMKNHIIIKYAEHKSNYFSYYAIKLCSKNFVKI